MLHLSINPVLFIVIRKYAKVLKYTFPELDKPIKQVRARQLCLKLSQKVQTISCRHLPNGAPLRVWDQDGPTAALQK